MRVKLISHSEHYEKQHSHSSHRSVNIHRIVTEAAEKGWTWCFWVKSWSEHLIYDFDGHWKEWVIVQMHPKRGTYSSVTFISTLSRSVCLKLLMSCDSLLGKTKNTHYCTNRRVVFIWSHRISCLYSNTWQQKHKGASAALINLLLNEGTVV